jgi:putative transposase
VGPENNYAALWPQSTRPHTIANKVPDWVVDIIYTIRKELGWGGHRLAAELKKRDIWQLSGQTVYRIFERLGLPVKTYALKGRSLGISYRRYTAKGPNQLWHIDLKHLKLSDGTPLYIAIVIDDYSRYVITAQAGFHKTSAWTTPVMQQALSLAGAPKALLSDNGTEFCSLWEESLTCFGVLLDQNNIDHLTTASYYPQANGKAEAFIKTLNRECLRHQTFHSLKEVQTVLDQFLSYYNHYRLHSALGWQKPAACYTACHISVTGLAQLPGLEPMAANPLYGPAYADLPLSISPFTFQRFRAIVPFSEC